MPNTRIVLLLVTGLIVLALPACGGGGQGLRVPNDPVKVMSTSMPPKLSGETMDHVIPIEGGCGGPYVLKVISGKMPLGLELVNETHAISGYLLEDGDFSWTIEVTDTGCTPFSTTTASFSMAVGIGEITVVTTRKDGNPAGIIPAGSKEYNQTPPYPALPETIFNELTLIELIVAGGKGPYTLELYQDDDIGSTQLPLGTSIIPNSTSITGTPIEEAAEGAFLCSFKITDSLNNEGFFTAYWLVYSPPIIIATTNLKDGQVGVDYKDEFYIAGGIQPFWHEFVEDDGSRDLVGAGNYPNATLAGPDYTSYLVPSEGMYLIQADGFLRGKPRRRGKFSVWYHVSSTLLPYSPRQNGWQKYTIDIAPANPVEHDPAYTLTPGSPFNENEPYTRIADFEYGAAYNPDDDAAGLQCLGMGGCPNDGWTDAPHDSQRVRDPTETEDSYRWEIDWTSKNGPGDPTGQIAGVEFSPAGVFTVPDPLALQTQMFQNIGLTVYDSALPTSTEATEFVRTSVGPDKLVVTVSQTSFTGGAGNSSYPAGIGMDDRKLTVQILLALIPPQLKVLDNARDLTGIGDDQSKIPATAGTGTDLEDLLTDVDLLRVSINPTGWWDDVYNLNPRGARGFQHSDANRTRGGMTNAYAYDYASGSYKQSYAAQPESTSVHLPEASIVHDASKGEYADGGRMYCFDGEDYFGIFVIRDDGKLYVPCAFEKGTSTANPSGAVCFGDNWCFDWKDSTSAPVPPVATVNMLPQMTVSPDGRVAAMKLMTRVATFGTSSSSTYAYSYAYSYYGDYANQSKIVLFSLTGEKLFDSETSTYKVIGTGSDGSTSYGRFHKSDTMTLTNNHLYYLCSNNGYRDAYAWREHYIYRYAVFGGGSNGELLRADDDDEWTNTPGTFMQAPAARFDRFISAYSSGTYKYQTSDATVYYDAMNVHEGAAAVHPFRVNADGNACGILAGRTTYGTTTTSSTDFYMHHVWLDWHDGTPNSDEDPTLYRLSSKKRHHMQGGGRGYKLTGSRNYYTNHWGSQTGPTTGFEISDDGKRVAAVVNRRTGSISVTASYAAQYLGARNDIIAFEPKDASGEWTSTGNLAGGETEIQITGSESTAAPVFTKAPALAWKFGALTFTKDNEGLVFWGGYCSYSPTWVSTGSYAYTYDSYTFAGSLYSYDFDTTTNTNGGVKSVLAKADGGANLSTTTTYTSSNQIGTSAWSSSYTKEAGVIKPVGGFLSANREYMYLVNVGALSTSKQENLRLVGVNIASLSRDDATNDDHEEGLGFSVGGWPSRYGFTLFYGSTSYPYAYYGIRYSNYAPGAIYGSEVVMAKDSGRVFFGGHYQNYGPGAVNSYSYPLLATYSMYAYYGPYMGEAFMFDSDAGGDVHQLTNYGGTGGSYSQATRRFMKYLEPTDDGTALAYVYAGAQTSYSYPIAQQDEYVGYIQGLNLDVHGDMVGSPTHVTDMAKGGGRVGSSVAHDPLGASLYFPKGSSSDENDKLIYKRSASDSSPTDVTANVRRRYNVLQAAR